MTKRVKRGLVVIGLAGVVAAGLTTMAGPQASVSASPLLVSDTAMVSTPLHPEADYMGSSVPAFERAAAPKLQPEAKSANAVAGTPGLDVSHYQNQVDWNSVAANGAKFAYVKATEGTTYLDPQFAANYTGSANVGLKRSAYHFGLPDQASGVDQATFFVAHGGGWSNDGKTLPPALDIEYNPYSTADWAGWCYNRTPAQIRAWINDFITTVHAHAHRWPVIYTTRGWWSHCTGSNTTIPVNSPLWIEPVASDAGGPPGMPAGWSAYTFYQWAHSGTFPGDQDVFAGTVSQLAAFAAGTTPAKLDEH
jgi:GH25 family lysozyme M1 (1,4-beta-N-acetylmuramidase)